MKQKIALILAATVTVFLLVIGGAIAGKMTQAAASPALPTTDEIQSLYAQREAEYQARIDEANLALTDAYARLDTIASATTTASVSNAPQEAVNSLTNISPQEAMLAAILADPRGRILRIPELVNFQGTVAYEVMLNNGTVYIDASSGSLLYNGATQTNLAQSQSSGGEYEEHEENDRD